MQTLLKVIIGNVRDEEENEVSRAFKVYWSTYKLIPVKKLFLNKEFPWKQQQLLWSFL